VLWEGFVLSDPLRAEKEKNRYVTQIVQLRGNIINHIFEKNVLFHQE
jgi:hypothetical protein